MGCKSPDRPERWEDQDEGKGARRNIWQSASKMLKATELVGVATCDLHREYHGLTHLPMRDLKEALVKSTT
jgi:hypothetical protein